VLSPGAAREFWYPAFHRLDLAERLIDGKPEAVRAYLRHFWSHWSGPDYEVDEAHLDHLVGVYSPPGAFTASVGWYRTSSSPDTAYVAETAPEPANRLGPPTTVLWQEFDPIFPREWSDRLDEFFADLSLEMLDGVGHYTPLEAPHRFASAIEKRLA
jgi:pimeloyl-ACP methyl ester carboxylesterase